MPIMTDNQLQALTRALKDTSVSADPHYWHRLHCVQLVAQGCSVATVAYWFQNDPSSVGRWVRHFKLYGAQGLLQEQKPGRPARLNPAQLTDLKADLSLPPADIRDAEVGRWTGQLLALHIEKKYGLIHSTRQCQRLLRQLRDATNEGSGDN